MVCYIGKAMQPGYAQVLAMSGGRQLSLLDSGCNTTVSGFRKDFAQIDWNQPVPIVGVGGTLNDGKGGTIHAYRAKFRKNTLGLQYGLFLRDLPMGRIIAMSALIHLGWSVTWDNSGCFLGRAGARTRCKVAGNLPYCDFKIQPEPSYGPVHRSEGSRRCSGDYPTWVYAVADDADHAIVEEIPMAADDDNHGLAEGQQWSMDLQAEPADVQNPQLTNPDPRSLEESLKAVNDVSDKHTGDNIPLSPRAKALLREHKQQEHDLLVHRSLGHLSHPGMIALGKHCTECAASKGGRSSVSKIRPEEYNTHEPMEHINVDFLGPLGTSIRGRKILFVAICDVSAYVWVFPQTHKTEHVENARALIRSIRANEGRLIGEKVVKSIRSDNEAVFAGHLWKEMLLDQEVRGWCPVPYTPQQNGVIERFMRTLASNVRASLVGVDHKLWCFCDEYIAWTWNRIPRPRYARAPRFNGLAPEGVRIARGFVPTSGAPRNSEESGGLQLDDLDPAEDEERLIRELKDPDTHADTVLYPEDLFPQIDVAISYLAKQSDTDQAGFLGAVLTAEDLSPLPQAQPEASDNSRVTSDVPSHSRPTRLADADINAEPSKVTKNTPSPLFPARDAYSRFKKVMHPFGVMAFVKYEPSGHRHKWQGKWVKMVFLGYSPNSSGWLFGWYTRTRSSSTQRFMTITSRSAKFTNFKVSNLEWVSVDAEKQFPDMDPFTQKQCDQAQYKLWEPELFGPHRGSAPEIMNPHPSHVDTQVSEKLSPARVQESPMKKRGRPPKEAGLGQSVRNENLPDPFKRPVGRPPGSKNVRTTFACEVEAEEHGAGGVSALYLESLLDLQITTCDFEQRDHVLAWSDIAGGFPGV